ncbi:MAG TPA: M42 family metallopeptidase [Candidatus Sulfotelmatobacter sp.]|nr:M42 family metallopeptidase [Candidatus Sulfotelmatobacter sp.]
MRFSRPFSGITCHESIRISLLALTLLALLCGTLAAQDDTTELLKALTEAAGPTGYEDPVRKIMADKMSPLADSVAYDAVGSIIATQGKTGPRIMIDAHMDELGALVRHITPEGFITVQTLGYWLDEALVGQRWTIEGSKGPVKAVSGLRDAHVVADADLGKLLDTHETLFLDVGAKSEEEARRMGIQPGDPIAPDSTFEILNGTRNYVGKAFDDRAGCAILIELMKRLAHAEHPNQLFYVGTVQEETNSRGAHASSDLIKPDVAIVLEAGITHDTPVSKPDEAQEVLGGGPGIFLFNSSEQPSRKFVALARETAHQKSIPLQEELVLNYGDDAVEIQKANGGVPTITLTVPTRYTHAHNGIINRDDYDRTVELMLALIQRLNAATVKQLRNFATQ